ncbi:hypothetical protein NPIL_97391 [Nephila pilipes]|uniref:Uncharacterized protein n=1 Tax=Nephila pilipes TaxID=299642 RepID=A0A8X6NKC7_NEPPI|nr:hypothetical protein NPIL_97391 [Nephila pilipes]
MFIRFRTFTGKVSACKYYYHRPRRESPQRQRFSSIHGTYDHFQKVDVATTSKGVTSSGHTTHKDRLAQEPALSFVTYLPCHLTAGRCLNIENSVAGEKTESLKYI